jgi:hypothetical protein
MRIAPRPIPAPTIVVSGQWSVDSGQIKLGTHWLRTLTTSLPVRVSWSAG